MPPDTTQLLGECSGHGVLGIRLLLISDGYSSIAALVAITCNKEIVAPGNVIFSAARSIKPLG